VLNSANLVAHPFWQVFGRFRLVKIGKAPDEMLFVHVLALVVDAVFSVFLGMGLGMGLEELHLRLLR